MTHFTVLVRFEGTLENLEEQIEKILAPYNETREVKPYKHYMSEKEIKSMAEHYWKIIKADEEIFAEERLTPDDLELLVKHMEDWSGYRGGIDEKGLFYWCTYNPKSKWDWWSLGGRYSGKLILKENAQGAFGRPGVFDNPVGIDAAFLKDVDFDIIEKEREATARKHWRNYQAKKKAKVKEPLELLYSVEQDETEETYVEKRKYFSTFAFCDKDGWKEAAKMGWWAIVHDRTEDEIIWAKKFRERFLSNPTEHTVIAVVDCHI